MARTFEHAPAVRRSVPVLLGLFGPSGSGKTYTADRLAAGMERVTKKPTFFIDTEAGRALHYADLFKFEHVPFVAPFGPLDYLAALQYCARQGAGQIICDSLSHVWEGEGGVLEMHEQQIDRMAGTDLSSKEVREKRERVKMTAWIKPKAEIRRLINGLLQIDCNFIFCFRAKEKMKIVTGKQPQALGFQPIIGDEFPYEMTMNLFLPPASNGVPDLAPTEVGERAMLKIPAQFRSLMKPGMVLTEDTGEALARWAMGEDIKPAPRPQPTQQSPTPTPPPAAASDDERLRAARIVMDITALLRKHQKTRKEADQELAIAFVGKTWSVIQKLPADELAAGLAALTKNLDGVAAMAGNGWDAHPDEERQPGEDDV